MTSSFHFHISSCITSHLISPISWQASITPFLQVTKAIQNLRQKLIFFSPCLFPSKKNRRPAAAHNYHQKNTHQGSAGPSRSSGLVPLHFESWNLTASHLFSSTDWMGYMCLKPLPMVNCSTLIWLIWLFHPPKEKVVFKLSIFWCCVCFRSTNVWILFWSFQWYWHVLNEFLHAFSFCVQHQMMCPACFTINLQGIPNRPTDTFPIQHDDDGHFGDLRIMRWILNLHHCWQGVHWWTFYLLDDGSDSLGS